MIKQKKAAMEMSVGTIVTVVLLMAVLILGIFLTQQIFKTSKGAIDMTDAELRNQIQQLFSNEETKIVIYPTSKSLEIKHEEQDAIGVGIKNLATTGSGTNVFSYVVQKSSGNCQSNIDPNEWIIVGDKEQEIPIAVGELYSTKIIFQIPLGTPICTARFRIDVKMDGNAYKSDQFDISIKG